MEYIEKIKIIFKRNIISFVSLIIAFLSIMGSVYYVHVNKCECENCSVIEQREDLIEPVKEEKEEIKKLIVDVKGAVKKPGVYILDEGSIVNDAIVASGGITSSGVTSNINLSKKLKDEMVIYIFSKSEIAKQNTNNKLVCEVPKCTCEQIVVDKDIEASKEKESLGESYASVEKTISNKISINTDSIADLTTLSGIGEAKAKAIIEYRKANGNFATIEDIKKVPGISDNIYEKIKDYITV